MESVRDKLARVSALAMSILFAFEVGFLSKDAIDKANLALAGEPAKVTVEKVSEPTSSFKSNRLLGPDLWDIYVDPFFVPVGIKAMPAPLVPLLNFSAQTPRVQTINEEKELRVVAQVPGMNENDVKVEASERSVTIKGHKQEKRGENDKFQSYEESFSQTVQLPCRVDADKVQATVKDGLLTVVLPKS